MLKVFPQYQVVSFLATETNGLLFLFYDSLTFGYQLLNTFYMKAPRDVKRWFMSYK